MKSDRTKSTNLTQCRIERLESRRMLASDSGADDFPNFVSDEVCLLSASVDGMLELENDRDVFAFDAEASEVLRFDISSEQLTAFRIDIIPEGTQRAVTQAFGTTLTFKAPTAGRYFVAVSSSLGTGSYTVDLSQPIDDPDELGQETAPLQSLVLDGAVSGDFVYAGDVDLFRLDVVEGMSYAVDLSRISIQRYPRMELFVLNEQQERDVIAQSDPWALDETRFEFESLFTGTYYLELSSAVSDPLGAYNVHLDFLGADDHPDVPSENAVLMELGQPIFVTPEAGREVDVLAFDAVAGENYRVKKSGPLSVTLRVLDADGVEVGRVGNSTQWHADRDGRFFVEASMRGQGRNGTLTLTLGEPDDFLDHIASNLLSLGFDESVEVNRDFVGDADFFRIDEAIASKTFRVTATPTNAVDEGVFPTLRLFDSSGSQVWRSVTDELLWEESEVQPAFLAIDVPDQGGPYSLKLVDPFQVEIPDDDVPDDQTVSVEIDVPWTGTIEVEGDSDKFVFAAEQGQVLRLWGTGLINRSIEITLPNGDIAVDRKAFGIPNTGTAQIEISGAVGEYSLMVIDTNIVDQYPDKPSTETPLLEQDVEFTSRSNFQGDVDVIAVNLQAGQAIAWSSPFAWEADVLDIEGNVQGELRSIRSLGNRAYWKSDIEETAFFAFRQRAIELRWNPIGPVDDHGDSIEHATPIDLTTTTTANISRRDLRDVFVYEAAGGELLRVDPTNEWQESSRVSMYVDGTWVRVDGNAWVATSGSNYFAVSGPLFSQQQFELSVGSDPEPNSVGAVPDSAMPIELGSHEGSIGFSTDVDLFPFDAEAGEFYSVSLSTDAVLARFVDAENKLALTFPESGRYFVEVRRIPGDGPIEFPYTLELATNETPGLISGEPVVTTELAPWHLLDAEVGKHYRFEIQSNGQLDRFSSLEIFSLPELQYIPVSARGIKFFRAPASQFYAVKADPWQDRAATLVMEDDIDDYPDLLSDPDIVTLAPNEEIFGELHADIDEDAFRFDVRPNEVFKFDLELIDPSSSDEMPFLRVYDVEANRLHWSAQGEYLALDPGSYFLRLERGKGSYRLNANSLIEEFAGLGNDDSPITSDITISGVSDYDGDVDVFFVEAEEGDNLFFDLLDTATSDSVRYRVFRGDNLLYGLNRWRARNSGTYRIELEPGITGPYELSIAYVTDENPGRSGDLESIPVVQLGETFQGMAEYAGDDEAFAFDVEAGVGFEIDFGSIQPTIWLQTPDGEVQFPSRFGAFSWTAQETGRHVIAFRMGIAGEYSAVLNVIEDDHGDTIEESTPIQLADNISGSFEAIGDTDVFVIDLEPERLYRMDRTANAIVRSENGPLPFLVDSLITYEFRAAASTTHYIELSEFNRVNYTLSISEVEPPVSIPDDVPVNPIGESILGQFEEVGDTNVFAFQLEQDAVFEVDFTRQSILNQTLTVVAPDRVEELVAVDDDPAVYRATAAGTYYVLLESSNRTGSYHVTVNQTAIDMPLSAEGELPELTVNGRIDYPNDIDTFTIDVEANQGYRFDIANNLRAGVDIEIYNTLGERVGVGQQVDADTDVLLWHALESGTYEVRLSGNFVGTYVVTTRPVTPLTEDDFPDTVADALESKLLEVDELLLGRFNDGDEVDLFPVELRSDRLYTASLSNRIVNWRLLSSDGDDLKSLIEEGNIFGVPVGGRYYVELKSPGGETDGDDSNYFFRFTGQERASESTPLLEPGVPFRYTTSGIRGAPHFFAIQLERGDKFVSSRSLDDILHSDGETEVLHGGQIASTDAPRTGTYFVVVESGRSVREIAITLDDFADDAPDFLDPESPTFSFGEDELRGELESRNDVDVFAFEALAGQIFRLRGGSAGIRILRPDGRAEKEVSPWKASETGRYYLEVQRTQTCCRYAFSFNVEMDDHPDRVTANAPQIVFDQDIEGSFETQSDFDVFSIDVAADRVYEFDFASDDFDAYRVRVLDNTGIPVANYNRNEPWTPETSGRYFLELAAPVEVGDYRFRVEELRVSEPGDLNGDGLFSPEDIDALLAASEQDEPDLRFDIDGNLAVNQADVDLYLSNQRILPGDIDLNGSVEFADFLVLSNAFGTESTGWKEGDFNGDGITDFADFLLLSLNFGKDSN